MSDMPSEQRTSVLEMSAPGVGQEERAAIVAAFWHHDPDARGLLHYRGPQVLEGASAEADAETEAQFMELWMLLCRRINLLEHDRRVVSLLDAWSFTPYFVATSDDPDVAHWLALLEALQSKRPLRACMACGDFFQVEYDAPLEHCSPACGETQTGAASHGAASHGAASHRAAHHPRSAARPGFSSRQLHSKSEL